MPTRWVEVDGDLDPVLLQSVLALVATHQQKNRGREPLIALESPVFAPTSVSARPAESLPRRPPLTNAERRWRYRQRQKLRRANAAQGVFRAPGDPLEPLAGMYRPRVPGMALTPAERQRNCRARKRLLAVTQGTARDVTKGHETVTMPVTKRHDVTARDVTKGHETVTMPSVTDADEFYAAYNELWPQFGTLPDARRATINGTILKAHSLEEWKLALPGIFTQNKGYWKTAQFEVLFTPKMIEHRFQLGMTERRNPSWRDSKAMPVVIAPVHAPGPRRTPEEEAKSREAGLRALRAIAEGKFVQISEQAPPQYGDYQVNVTAEDRERWDRKKPGGRPMMPVGDVLKKVASK